MAGDLPQKPGNGVKDPSSEAGEPNRASDETPSEASFWINRDISHYRVSEKIGAGGMGVVYKAVDTRLNRTVAIKVLPKAKVGDPERRRRFIREAQAASSLNHPNIVTIYEIASEGDTDFIAMEYISGATLHELIHKQGLPTKDALKYAIQITDALAAAHANGIVHRDLKPANIMVTAKGLVKILDFGLAKLSPQFGDPDVTRTMVTTQGMLVGTLCYMSPEQAEGKDVDWRSDIFSFGIVLYEMTSGKSPFAGETPLSTLSAILVKDPLPFSVVAPGASTALEKLISRCLCKMPADRVQQMDELKSALEELTLPGAMSEVARTVKPKSARRIPWKAGAAAFGAIAIAAVAGPVWRSLSRPPDAPAAAVLSRLTSESGLASYPAISADGKLLAYASDRDGQVGLDIWVQQIGGGDPIRRTTDEADEYEPEFSRDGTQLVYRSEKDTGGIYVIPTLQGSPLLISREGRRPRFSPDAKQIAYWTGFTSPSFHPGSMKVWVAPVGGGPPRQVAGTFDSVRNPVWLPDGKRLLVVGRLKDTDSIDWWVIPVDGGQPVRTGAFALFKAHNLLPSPLENVIVPEMLAPETDRVLFSATLGDATNIWQVPLDLETGKIVDMPVHLTSGAGLEIQSSAGGSKGDAPVAFSALTLNVDVWTLPLDVRGKPNGEMRPLTRTLSTDGWPFVSPDGKKVVYTSYQSDQGVLRIRDVATGTEKTALTTPFKGEVMAKISPDGTRVAYANDTTHTGYIVGAEGGAPEQICERCILADSWMQDSRRVLFTVGNDAERFALVDHVSKKRTSYPGPASHPEYMMAAGRFSPDSRWISFHLRPSPVVRQIFVAPLNGEVPAAEPQWIPITDGKNMDREAAWSLDGNTLYFVSDRDGFRCIWAQPLNAATKQLAAAFAIQHFHHARRSMTAVGANTGAIGLSVYKGGLVFALGEITGNIWVSSTK